VLTAAGQALRERVQQEFIARMPWRNLDDEERVCLLALTRKMIRAESGVDDGSTTTPPTTRGQRAGEVSETLVTAQPGG
jgi:hypothetical protein